MSDIELYIPHQPDTIKGRLQTGFRRLSYDHWRRELKRRGLEVASIADVGCGPGFLLACLEQWFPAAHVTGVDASEKLLSIARERCGRSVLLKGDATSLPLASGSIDVVFALHVVEHLKEPEAFFLESMRILRPGGILIIATPNLCGIGSRLMKKKWQGYRDPTHISLGDPAVWRNYLNEAGFLLLRQGTTGLGGVPGMNRLPFGLIHWIPTFVFGFFQWSLGEAYVCVAGKPL